MSDVRDTLVERMKVDLMGPESPEEVISDRPTDRYLTGILFPPRTAIPAEEDDEAADSEDSEVNGTALDGVKAASTFRPSTAGLSFAVEPADGSPVLRVKVDGARYLEHESEESDGQTGGRKSQSWKRDPRSAEILLDLTAASQPGFPGILLGDKGQPGVTLHARIAQWQSVLLVTLAISNDAGAAEKTSRTANEKAALFQVAITVFCEADCRFVPKPAPTGASGGDDEDRASSALLYRRTQQWAVGHTCSAIWDEPLEETVSWVATSWFPEATVHVVSASGARNFHTGPVSDILSASILAGTGQENLVTGLTTFVDAYSNWIKDAEKQVGDLPANLTGQGGLHIRTCHAAEARMRAGIELVRTDRNALEAFRMANAAMALQYSWRPDASPSGLIWRPFQVGFALLCISSIARPDDDDRDTMDLLWFPTGGGKTEAYLLLTAFTIFLRRLRASGDPAGGGVTTFMRYTLRLLTIQQFERAAALIIACEMIRKGLAESGAAQPPSHFASDAPISLGLWVGQGATPNFVKDAEVALSAESENSPAQLRACPCCRETLDWRIAPDRSCVEARCLTSGCVISSGMERLPVWTVDEDLYNRQPTLVIGTVDKYAQITRNQETGKLFGIGISASPPDLIIQDELHLISGPLGSLAGLYETAIDELCRTSEGRRAKVIGSTATIRRASQQIRALFDRSSFQFPPPGLDYSDSGFAVEDKALPGRRYVGISTVGRSAKFTQQAVSASLLQAATDPGIPDQVRDGYWTLINYFNSLRELGGALVLMRDDVTRSIGDYAGRRSGESERLIDNQIELTSRVRSIEIPRYLKNLERGWQHEEHVDIVLASNMISVGMDVSRLGLMLVNGQPKTIAEYIQATSRVGRDKRWPGLVVTLFNAAKSRDRSRYETFSSWHGSLYREVEATSVTPFAPRARDRALHAPFVALVRHLITGMADPGAIEDHQNEAEALLERIVQRVERIDPGEAGSARKQLNDFLDGWFDFQGLKTYWSDFDVALLTSAETAAARGNRGRYKGQKPTPNSLRSVEASTPFVLLEHPRSREERR
ncbi:DNA helicase [Rhizobium ruizarguesonis]|uniref:DNA helicase n=1 Tax=Rhizobium ruizarguesonis TaxID=2081791 RepID=UPI00040E9A7E|nr:DNA helicase [Rhizobium ruizarguesonis]QJS31283.1 DNA helicase [Rhizobium leguminosarum bv. trifolii TA1]TBB35891.1 DNA helicase [Rhizobium ruizarguesonis]UFW98095.1 DNA/RNA helicase [Rhizobium ruizarguesonis]